MLDLNFLNCLSWAMFSLLASVLEFNYLFSRSKPLQDVYFVSPNVFLLNIAKTNYYKVVTGPVTSGSKFLQVQKHFALFED